MPVMEGAQATQIIMKQSPCAILVVTATVSGNAAKVFEALSCGALDAVATPVFGGSGGIEGGAELLRKIAVIGRLIVHAQAPAQAALRLGPRRRSEPAPRMVALGASTGGPNALAIILRGLPATPRGRGGDCAAPGRPVRPGLVDWLSEQTALPWLLAREGMFPEAGSVFVAGTNDHLVIGADLALPLHRRPRGLCLPPFRGRVFPQPGPPLAPARHGCAC